MHSLAEVPHEELDDLTDREVEAIVDEVLAPFREQHFEHFMSRGSFSFRDAKQRSPAEALADAMSHLYPDGK